MQRLSEVKHCQGYLLLEALIAIAVFSIGILGIAMTQLEMTRQTTHTKYRLKAQSLIDSAIVDIQSNPANKDCYLTTESCGDEWREKVKRLPGYDTQNYTVTRDDDNRITFILSWSIPSEKTYSGSDVWHQVEGSVTPIIGLIE